MTMPILILPISVKMLTLGDTHVKYKVLCWMFYLKSQFILPQSSFLFKLKKKHKLCKHRAVCLKALCLQWGGVGSGIGCEGRALPLVKVTIL